MSVKSTFTLTTLAGSNEQSGASPVTVTATGNSREYREFAAFNRAILFLDVSAASGTTPSLTVALQVQDPVSLKWQNVASFAAQTAVTGATPLAPVTVELYALNYRAAWTVSGTTPSFTFSFVAVVGCEEPVP